MNQLNVIPFEGCGKDLVKDNIVYIVETYSDDVHVYVFIRVSSTIITVNGEVLPSYWKGNLHDLIHKDCCRDPSMVKEV